MIWRIVFPMLLMASSVLSAQPSPLVIEIVDNHRKLTSTIELDRPVYFLLEEALLTVIVRNPTAGPLRVATPFRRETGALGLMEQTVPGEWQSMDPHAGSERLFNEQTPWTTLNPGEERQISLKSTDFQFGSERNALLTRSAPSQPGLYQVYYSMGDGRKNFRVVEPFFEAAGEATLRAEEVVVENGETLRLAQSIRAFAVRWEGVSYICVAYPNTGGGISYPGIGQRLRHSHIAGIVHKRVFTSTVPITQLQVQEEVSGNFVITYTDANAQTGLIRLSPTLQPL